MQKKSKVAFEIVLSSIRRRETLRVCLVGKESLTVKIEINKTGMVIGHVVVVLPTASPTLIRHVGVTQTYAEHRLDRHFECNSNNSKNNRRPIHLPRAGYYIEKFFTDFFLKKKKPNSSKETNK